MSKQQCRWGILGAAAIARKNWAAMARSSSGYCVAVASRDLRRCQQFRDECSADVPMTDSGGVVDVDALPDYQSLLDREDIDAVYIPLPTGCRKKWVLAAAKAGKHVLSEKPAALDTTELDEMLDACRSNRVQWMDGVMFDHSLRLPKIVAASADGSIGSLRRIQTHFSFNGGDDFAADNIRSDATLEPHGCLGDLGWYCIRMILWLNGFESPTKVRGESLWTIGDRVPGEWTGEMRFASGVSASIFCSFRAADQQSMTATGADGYLSLDDFVLPFHGGTTTFHQCRHLVDMDRCRWYPVRREAPVQTDEYSSGESSAQEVRMVEHINRIVIEGTIDESAFHRTRQTQVVLDAMRSSESCQGGWISL